jgi:hypothetical protein
MGAINNPFADRIKETYEDAFEHFLSQKYSLNEAEEDMEEGKEVEEPSLYEGELNEDIRAIVTKIFDNISSNSEKENNDLIELGNAIFTPEGAKIVANAIKFKLKQTDQIPGQMYYGDKEELDAFLSKLK